MNLPETVGISIQGPSTLLDLGGKHWGDDIIFDSTTGGLDPDAGFKQSTKLLTQVIEEVLMGKCEYATREILIFGFGQGGMVGLEVGCEFTFPFHVLPASPTNSSQRLSKIQNSAASSASDLACRVILLRRWIQRARLRSWYAQARTRVL